jgi:hypothetical protein
MLKPVILHLQYPIHTPDFSLSGTKNRRHNPTNADVVVFRKRAGKGYMMLYRVQGALKQGV